jgi:hypothetical protein
LYAYGTSRHERRSAAEDWDEDLEAAADTLTSPGHRGGYVLLGVLLGLAGGIRGIRGRVFGLSGAVLGIAALMYFQTFMRDRVSKTREILGGSVELTFTTTSRLVLVGLALAVLCNSLRLVTSVADETSRVRWPSPETRRAWTTRFGLVSGLVLGFSFGAQWAIDLELGLPWVFSFGLLGLLGWGGVCWRSYSRWRKGESARPTAVNVSGFLVTISLLFILILAFVSWVRTLA